MEVQITDSKSLEINILNSRSLSLITNNIKGIELRDCYTEFNYPFETNEILELRFEGKSPYVIKLGETIDIDKNTYTINKILCGRNNEYILIDQEINKSAKYILPLLLPLGATATGYLYNKCLYNTYLYCNKYPKLSNEKFLFLKYRFFDNPVYKILESLITSQKNFVLVDDSEKGFATFVLDIGEEFSGNIEYFKQGKYHMFKDLHDNKITGFFNFNKNEGDYKPIYMQIHQTLNRTKEGIKKLEDKLGVILPEGMGLESKPDLLKETLNL